MKILFLTDDFPPQSFGGAGIAAFNLAKGLYEHGHKVYIITTIQKESEEKKFELDGLIVYQIYAKYYPRWNAYLCLYNPQTIFKLKKIIQEIKPDIVHVHNIYQYFSYYCLKIVKKYSKAVFLTAHDVILFNYGKIMPKHNNCFYKVSICDHIKAAQKRYNPFRNIIIRHYLKYVDKIFSVSNALKKLLEINNIKNIETIYNGINISDWEIDSKSVEAFKKKYNIQNKKIILFGGRLSGAKGGNELLEAVNLIKKEINNITLIVIGKTDIFYVRQYVEKMKNLIKKLNIEENVIFTGWLDGDELRAAYYSMDVFILPSIWFETFGMGNLEAMACKKPVVSSYFGGPSEVVLDPEKGGTGKQTGYLVNPNNVELMTKKIINLLKNPEKAEKFGEFGYNRVKENFSLENQVDKILKWYKKYVKF